MKKLFSLMLLSIIIGDIQGADLESYEFIDHLLNIKSPHAPQIFEDAVVFTASSKFNRVGVAFLHENWSKIHYFKKILTPIDDTAPFDEKAKTAPELLKDSGLLFFAYIIPDDDKDNIKSIEYRLVMDGLWTVDPANPNRHFDSSSGKEYSIAPVPARIKLPQTTGNPPGVLHFSIKTNPGEIVTVAGNFNNWDPFMYRLREITSGFYVLDLPVPAGIWHYAFFIRGEQINDPNNPYKEWTSDGKLISVASVE